MSIATINGRKKVLPLLAAVLLVLAVTACNPSEGDANPAAADGGAVAEPLAQEPMVEEPLAEEPVEDEPLTVEPAAVPDEEAGAGEAGGEAPEAETAEVAQDPQAAAQPEGGDDQARAQEQAAGQGEMGETAYANCATCHGANGEGTPGAFPPLAGHMPTLAQAEGGREYLVNVLLYGLQGEIVVDGQTYNGVMPAWGQLPDEQIAAVLNHELTSWGNAEALGDFAPYTADEVAAQRDAGLDMQAVYQQRQELGLE